MKKVCLIIGAGAGIGGSVGAKFAANGYHAALCRRSDAEGLQKLVDGIESSGGTASGHMLNAVEEGAIEKLVEEVEQIGPIEVVLFNLGAQIGNRSLESTALKTFELGWQMACMGLFRLAKAVIPAMEARGTGTILVTSARCGSRQRRPAFTRGCHGRPTHALSNLERRIRFQGHSRCAHHRGWCRRCTRHTWENARC